MKLFQTKVVFLRHKIYPRKYKPIYRCLEFGKKFLVEIKNKTQLQKFLGWLNYV